EESLRGLAAERLRRVVGLPEGPRRTARPSRSGRGHIDPGRIRILAVLRPRRNPAVSPLPRPREGTAAGRGGPDARFDPFDGPGGRDALEADRYGDVVHEEAHFGESLLGPRAAQRPERGPHEGRPDLQPVRPPARGRAR